MNEMIERYIYDVTRRLPEKERGEIRRELEASITDMLPDDPGEQDIIGVLTNLGSPRVLAERYRQTPRYLISPAMFDIYISTLKTVTLIVAVVCACAGFIMNIFSGSVYTIAAKSIGMAFSGALQAALWVTIGFVIAEHSGAYKEKRWTVGDLPRLPEQSGVKIKRSSTLTEMGLTVFFTILFTAMIIRGEVFFIFVRNSEIINPFSQAALDRLIPHIILLGCMALIADGFKLYWARWNIPLCVINAVRNVAQVSIVIYILRWPDLLSGDFIEFALTLSGKVSFLRPGGFAVFFSVIFVAAAMIDTAIGVWSTWKGTRYV
ncbi:MAG: hypothetical protein FWH16_01725 [Oscillospiraceae bacterium]|nr:hypothetical protein [Oscillospiraceae bacterium]